MLLKILIAVGALLLVFVLVVATRPDTYAVARSTTIAAPPAVVYAQIADFAAWPSWSPWAKLDPNMKTTYTGAPGSPGAVYQWTGDDKVGSGRMTLLSTQLPSKIEIVLEFLKPFASTSLTTFELNPAGAGTLVTWSMAGNHNFMMKGLSMFMSMDKMIGGDFEKGLANLKDVSQKAAAAAPAPVAAPAAAQVQAAAK